MTSTLLFRALYTAILHGDETAARNQTIQLLAEKNSAELILNTICIPAMQEVKQRLEKGEMYIPELLIAQRAYQSSLEVLQSGLSHQEFQIAQGRAEIDWSCFL